MPPAIKPALNCAGVDTCRLPKLVAFRISMSVAFADNRRLLVAFRYMPVSVSDVNENVGDAALPLAPRKVVVVVCVRM